jgi:hypothetical protein
MDADLTADGVCLSQSLALQVRRTKGNTPASEPLETIGRGMSALDMLGVDHRVGKITATVADACLRSGDASVMLPLPGDGLVEFSPTKQRTPWDRDEDSQDKLVHFISPLTRSGRWPEVGRAVGVQKLIGIARRVRECIGPIVVVSTPEAMRGRPTLVGKTETRAVMERHSVKIHVGSD